MKSLKKNYFYNVVYQLLLIAIPIITVPYTSRVLGAEKIGIYSFTYSIVYYFMLFALLGMNNHGNREIAKVREDKTKLSRTFWNIYAVQLIASLIAIVGYLLYLGFFANEFKNIAWIQGLSLLSAVFDINWFFYGLEEFKVTVVRSAIVKVLSLACIFVFVRTADDLPIYTIIMAGGMLLSQLVLLPFASKYIELVKPRWKEMKTHMIRSLVLFIPVVSISLYTIMDKIMLGVMSNVTEVGYYNQAERMISIPMALITSIGTVMMPRMSNLVAKNNRVQIMKYMEKSVGAMALMTVPMMFGMIAIAQAFIPLFLGPGFEKSVVILILLATVMMFKGMGNVLRVQYMTPHRMDKEYVYITIIGALVNLAVNLLLISQYSSIGACIGTIVAETAVIVTMCLFLKKKLPISKYLKICGKYMWKGIVMFIVILPFNFVPGLGNVEKVVLEVGLGVVVYGVLNLREIKEMIEFEKLKGKIRIRK